MVLINVIINTKNASNLTYVYRYGDMVPDKQKVLTDGYSLVYVTICFALIITCNIKEAMLHSLFLRLKKGTLLVPCLRV